VDAIADAVRSRGARRGGHEVFQGCGPIAVVYRDCLRANRDGRFGDVTSRTLDGLRPAPAGQAHGMDEKNRARFEAAVERRKHEARERSHDPGPGNPAASPVDGDQHSPIDDAKTQDAFSARQKNRGKGQKTADKWNQ
jgi:hypothetical protein